MYKHRRCSLPLAVAHCPSSVDTQWGCLGVTGGCLCQGCLLWFTFEDRIPWVLRVLPEQEPLLHFKGIEKGWLELLGYCMGPLGDFNERIAPSPNFDFRSNPHCENNNGELLGSFLFNTICSVWTLSLGTPAGRSCSRTRGIWVSILTGPS